MIPTKLNDNLGAKNYGQFKIISLYKFEASLQKLN
jgi:hypothetical protein